MVTADLISGILPKLIKKKSAFLYFQFSRLKVNTFFFHKLSDFYILLCNIKLVNTKLVNFKVLTWHKKAEKLLDETTEVVRDSKRHLCGCHLTHTTYPNMATALPDGSSPPPSPPGEAVHDLQRCLGGWWVSSGFHMNAWNQFPSRTMLCDKIINVIHFTSQWF